MSGRARIIAFCACCAAGWASLVLLFPGLDASAVRWRTRAITERCDRSGASTRHSL